MKNLLTAVSAFAFAGMALADGIDTTQFGILAVPSSAAETIVAVPWLASGTGTESVKVADLLFKDDLSVGDELLYWNGSSYTAWRLNNSKEWEGASNVSTGSVTDSDGETTATLSCGSAIILRRKTVSKNYFRIMGKPSSGSKTVTLPASAYSLVAPTQTSGAVDVNSLTWTGLEAKNDFLYIPDPTTRKMEIYKYSPTDPAGWKNTTTGEKGGTIKAGTGAWFYTKGTSARTVTF